MFVMSNMLISTIVAALTAMLKIIINKKNKKSIDNANNINDNNNSQNNNKNNIDNVNNHNVLLVLISVTVEIVIVTDTK